MASFHLPEKGTVLFNQVAVVGDQSFPSYQMKVCLRYLGREGERPWCERLLHRLGMTRQQLGQAYIPAHLMLAALQQIQDQFFEPGLGFRIGASIKLEDLGNMGRCFMRTSTLGEAQAICQAYYDQIGSFTDIVNIFNGASITHRQINILGLDDRMMQYILEFTLGQSYALARALCGQETKMNSISFSMPLDSGTQRVYERVFGCEILDCACFFEANIARELMSIPVKPEVWMQYQELNRNADPQDGQVMDDFRGLVNEMTRNTGKESLVDEIHRVLISCRGDYPDSTMMAHAFGMSARTLRRQLQELGTSYQALVNKCRCQWALRLLYENKLTTDEVAERLGFSDTANFRNAFKRWIGKKTTEIRE